VKARYRFLDPAKIFSVREITGVYTLSWELENIVYGKNTPQALLRDLHRPVKNWTVNPIEFGFVERPNDGGRGYIAELKRTALANYRVPMPTMVPTRTMYKESIAERRAVLRKPWADAPKFGSQVLPFHLQMF
jgi:hypothetical protein